MADVIKPSWMEGFVPDPAPPGGRWPKGVSGNPAGRPKGSLSKSDKIARALNEAGIACVMIDADMVDARAWDGERAHRLVSEAIDRVLQKGR